MAAARLRIDPTHRVFRRLHQAILLSVANATLSRVAGKGRQYDRQNLIVLRRVAWCNAYPAG